MSVLTFDNWTTIADNWDGAGGITRHLADIGTVMSSNGVHMAIPETTGPLCSFPTPTEAQAYLYRCAGLETVYA